MSHSPNNIYINGYPLKSPACRQLIDHNGNVNLGAVRIQRNGEVLLPDSNWVEPDGTVHWYNTIVSRNGAVQYTNLSPGNRFKSYNLAKQSRPSLSMAPKASTASRKAPSAPSRALNDATNKANVSPKKTESQEKPGGSAVVGKDSAANHIPRDTLTASEKQKQLLVQNVNEEIRQSTTGAAQTGSNKRKSNDSAFRNVDFDEDEDDDCANMPVDLNCDQVRTRIRRCLDSGEMKVGEFCDKIGVTNKSLNGFLGQSGQMKGAGSNTYINAFRYFKKLELVGVKLPNPNKKQKTSANAAQAAGESTKHAPAKAPANVSTIELDGQWQDDVPVYDTCGEIRKKISTYLTKEGVTKAQFCRDLVAQLHSPGASNIKSSQLDTFRNKKGPTAGNTSSVYYAAYVFFEKKRIAEGKPKSKHRIEMEKIWANGTDRERDGSRAFVTVPADVQPYVDKWGKTYFEKCKPRRR